MKYQRMDEEYDTFKNDNSNENDSFTKIVVNTPSDNRETFNKNMIIIDQTLNVKD